MKTNGKWMNCTTKKQTTVPTNTIMSISSFNSRIRNGIQWIQLLGMTYLAFKQGFHANSNLIQVSVVAKCQWHLTAIPELIWHELAASLHQFLADRCLPHKNHIQNAMPISLRHSIFPSYQPNNNAYLNEINHNCQIEGFVQPL